MSKETIGSVDCPVPVCGATAEVRKANSGVLYVVCPCCGTFNPDPRALKSEPPFQEYILENMKFLPVEPLVEQPVTPVSEPVEITGNDDWLSELGSTGESAGVVDDSPVQAPVVQQAEPPEKTEPEPEVPEAAELEQESAPVADKKNTDTVDDEEPESGDVGLLELV